MPNPARLAANRENARASTGPRTPEGKTASSRNAVTTGLYTAGAYIIPGEEEIFEEFAARYLAELRPVGLAEETYVAEITGAAWRLRRCSIVDTDPYAPPALIASIERARSHAHNVLRRSYAELRRLQTERQTRNELDSIADQEMPGAADTRQVKLACNHAHRAALLHHRVSTLPRPATALGSFCKNTEAPPPNARNAPPPTAEAMAEAA